jgi:hypothetical protein
MAQHRLEWSPGKWGKGFIDEDGSVVSWPTDGRYGQPHHAEVFSGDMIDTYNVLQNHAGFTIDRDGTIEFPVGGQSQRKDYILQADPRLKHDDDREHWKFTSNETANWTPGQPGKGLLLNDGSIHSWVTDHPTDGEPSHYEQYGRVVVPELSNYRDISKHYDDNVDTAFWISPEGDVSIPDRNAPHPRLERSLKQVHPETQMDYKDWQFTASEDHPNRQRWLDAWDEGIGRLPRYTETQMVPVEALRPYMEWDRELGHDQYTRDLYDHIQQHGINEGLFLDYNPDTGKGHISEGNHRLQIADQIGISHVPLTVYRSQRKPRNGQWEGHPLPQQVEPDRYNYVPQTIRPTDVGLPGLPIDETQFTSSVNNATTAPYAQQLTAWLNEVGQQIDGTEPLTPHHRDGSDFIEEPGVLARMKNKVKGLIGRNQAPKLSSEECPQCRAPNGNWPCDRCGWSPPVDSNDSYEQQKNDWYDQNNKRPGWPTKWPFESEPWRTEHHAPTVQLSNRQTASQSVSEGDKVGDDVQGNGRGDIHGDRHGLHVGVQPASTDGRVPEMLQRSQAGGRQGIQHQVPESDHGRERQTMRGDRDVRPHPERGDRMGRRAIHQREGKERDGVNEDFRSGRRSGVRDPQDMDVVPRMHEATRTPRRTGGIRVVRLWGEGAAEQAQSKQRMGAPGREQRPDPASGTLSLPVMYHGTRTEGLPDQSWIDRWGRRPMFMTSVPKQAQGYGMVMHEFNAAPKNPLVVTHQQDENGRALGSWRDQVEREMAKRYGGDPEDHGWSNAKAYGHDAIVYHWLGDRNYSDDNKYAISPKPYSWVIGLDPSIVSYTGNSTTDDWDNPGQWVPYDHKKYTATLPQVVWYGEPPHRLQGDHSFAYHPATNTINIGTPDLHHEALPGKGKAPEYEYGSIYDQNVNMDTEVPIERRNEIARALHLPSDDEWQFDPDYWKHQ